jgi:tellurite resistance protein TerA
MTTLTKGANTPVNASAVRVVLTWTTTPAGPDVDISALLLDVSGKVRGDGDFVYYNAPRHASGAVAHADKQAAADGSSTDSITVDLVALETGIERIIIAASSDGGTFGQVPGLRLLVLDGAGGTELVRFEDMGASSETAFVAGELYRRAGGWKFRAVGQGWESGLAGLAKDFGISVDDPAPPAAVPPPSRPSPTPTAATPRAGTPDAGQPSAPVSLTKVTLTKSAPAVSLTKSGSAGGILRVNLNWDTRPAKQQPQGGFLKRLAASSASGIDLDVGCLYELTDGSTGVVQALGNSFRDRRPGDPVCWLEGDDRSGSNTSGENLFVNLKYLREIRRVLVFAFIYEGVASWAAANAVVTVFPASGPQVEVRLDEHDPKATMCAIALLTNTGAELSLRREVRYVSGHRQLDEAYGWGLKWAAARK